jgi:tetratricopeptide (TPR) repeat protein
MSLNMAMKIDDKEEEEIKYLQIREAVYKPFLPYREASVYYDKRDKKTAYKNMGLAYQALGKYTEAKKYHGRSLSMAKEVGDKKGEGTAYKNMGLAYQAMGKCTEAKKYHEMSLSIAVEIGDKKGEETAYKNMGVVYESLGQHKEAMKYHKMSLGSAMKMYDKRKRTVLVLVLVVLITFCIALVFHRVFRFLHH